MAEFLVTATLAVWLSAATTIDAWEFTSIAEEQRYTALIAEFRCPKCLNTNLSGSNAQIAQDLRRAVYELIVEGKSDQEIRDYLQARYGDFVLYDPPMRIDTAVLWVVPTILLALGVFILLRVGTRRAPVELTDEERGKLAALQSDLTDQADTPEHAGVDNAGERE